MKKPASATRRGFLCADFNADSRNAARRSNAPQDVTLCLMRDAQHVEERISALRQAVGNLLRLVAGVAFVEAVVRFAAVLIAHFNRRFPLPGAHPSLVL